MSTFEKITIEVMVNAPIDNVWKHWNTPQDIEQWCSASPDWHTINAKNDLRVGGQLTSRMEAKDGSFGFDFGGTYDIVETNSRIVYTLGDSRIVDTRFTAEGNGTKVVQIFDAETQNPIEMQRGGWQAILDNFKAYAEKKG